MSIPSGVTVIVIILVLTLLAIRGVVRESQLLTQHAACITQLDSITTARQFTIMEMDTMIAKLRQPYAEPRQ